MVPRMKGTKDVVLFLVSLSPGRTVNYPISQDQWLDILDCARSNGWRPQGTVLDYEFQYNYAVSAFDEIDEDLRKTVADEIKTRCFDWQGGYATGDFQLVTGDDTSALADSLRTVSIPEDLRRLLELGPFRIGS